MMLAQKFRLEFEFEIELLLQEAHGNLQVYLKRSVLFWKSKNKWRRYNILVRSGLSTLSFQILFLK